MIGINGYLKFIKWKGLIMNLQIYLFFNWSLIIILIHKIWIKNQKSTRYLVISFILSLIGFLFNNLPVVVSFGLVLVFSSPHLFSWNYIKTNKKFIISINLLLYLYYPMILYRIINSYNSYL